MEQIEKVAREHAEITRRYFMKLGAAGAGVLGLSPVWGGEGTSESVLAEAVSRLEYLTKEEDFINFGRGTPPPHTLGADKLREVGLARDTWQLEVVGDVDSNSKIERPLSKEAGTALDWDGFMKLAEKSAVRFMSVMSCTNGRKPCGMGLWEGVPLRDVVWLANPKSNVRRVFYYGYHNDDLGQRFQSSLPIGRVLEDPPGEHPVILCYKLNDEWLTAKRGGPVRMIVPEEYGNKSVKWIQRIVLTNEHQANDTYAGWNNDTVSQIKTCARFIHVPKKTKAGEGFAITGVGQVGMSGLSKVQYLLSPKGEKPTENDPYFTKAAWTDAEVLGAPDDWGGGLKDGKLPAVVRQVDESGKPYQWPMRYTLVHWAAVLKIAEAGEYDLRCRTIDSNGVGQPMPRPFAKSGHNSIQRVELIAVK